MRISAGMMAVAAEVGAGRGEGEEDAGGVVEGCVLRRDEGWSERHNGSPIPLGFL